MSKEIEHIKEMARALGACDLVEKIQGWRTLVGTMMSPQGIEFLAAHQEAALEELVRHQEILAHYGVYVNAGDVRLNRRQNVIIIGQTKAKVNVRGCEKVRTFAALAGAELHVEASDYAVVRIHMHSDKVTTRNLDGTARFLF